MIPSGYQQCIATLCLQHDRRGVRIGRVVLGGKDAVGLFLGDSPARGHFDLVGPA